MTCAYLMINLIPTSTNLQVHSAIDLTLCDPVSYMDYGWKVHDDLCGSDHFPILLEIL